MGVRDPGEAVVRQNQLEVERIAGLIRLPAALVGVAVAHIGRELDVSPSEVLGTLGMAIDRLRARGMRTKVDAGAGSSAPAIQGQPSGPTARKR